MKNFMAVVGLLAVGTVGAQELKFGDLNYFYKKGQLDADLNVTMLHEDQVADLGATSYKLYSLGYIGSAKATYGVMDKLNVFVQTEYAYELNTDNGDPKSRSFNSDGFRNVGLGGDYRLFNQGDHLFNLDVGALVKAPIEDAVRGVNVNALHDGNYADIGSSVELRAKAGRKWDLANEVFFTAGVVYNTGGEYIQKGGTDVAIEHDYSIDYKVSGNYQWRPVNTFMTGFGVGATYVGEKKATSDVSQNVFEGTHDSHLDFTFNFVAKYLVWENFILSLNVVDYRLADYDAAGVEVRRRNSHSYAFGVNYLFE